MAQVAKYLLYNHEHLTQILNTNIQTQVVLVPVIQHWSGRDKNVGSIRDITSKIKVEIHW